MSNSNSLHAELLASRQGAPNLLINGTPLHSTYDPIAEAGKTAAKIEPEETALIVVLENGLGYLPCQLNRLYPQTDILIITPDPRIFDFLARHRLDYRSTLSPRVRILSPYDEKSFAAVLSDYPPSAVRLLIPPSMEKLFTETADRMRALTAYHRQIEETNTATLKKYGKRFEKNIRRNIEKLKNSRFRSFEDLRAGACGRHVVIAGAGPTLDAHLEEIRQNRDRFLLLAVDTAAALLQRQGIAPDYVVTGDPQFYNAMHLLFFRSENTGLIAPLSTYYINTEKSWKECYFYATRFPAEAAEADKNRIPLLGSGGTVAAAATEAARFMGAATVSLVGIDLGYPSFQTHAKGSFFEEKSIDAATRTTPFETYSYRLLFSPLKTETVDADGNRLLSDRRMDLYRRWFAGYARECKRIDRRGSLIDTVPVQNFLFEKNC